jgi:autotransporter-associated beta strand protein
MDGGSGGGAVAIVKSGTGTQTLTGNKNIYTGTTAVNGGVLSVGTLAANGTTSDIGKGTTLSFDGGTLSYTGGANTTFNRDITLNAGGGTIETASSLSCPGVISGTTGAAFIKTGAGALTLGGSGNNTYTGTTTLGGTGKILLAKTGGATAIAGNINLASTAWNGNGSGIVLGGNEQIADTSILTWTTTAYGGGAQAPSFFRLNGNSETIGGLVGSGANAVIENRGHNDTASYGTGTLTINTTGSSSCTFGGTIRDMDGGTGGGAVAIVKSGTGTQTLTGTNVYTGTTTVTNGTLHLAGGSESSPITVNNGAFLGFTLGTTITSSSSVTLDSGSKIKITGTPTLPSYTLIATTSGITGTPVLDTAIPGYALVVDGTSLKLNASGSPYTTWAATFLPGDDVSNPAGDNDNDGLFNQQEFAFGLSPISGSSVNPILVPLDKTTGTFTYQRRAGTGLTYRILTSTDLVSWPEDVTATASQVDGAVDGNGNQIVVVTLSGAKPLTATKLFVRVAAD